MLNFQHKRVLIMGLGLHGGGVGTAKFFVEQGADVTVTDLKINDDLAPSLEKLRRYNIRYVLGRHEEEDFKKSDLIIQNPGVPSDSYYLKIAKKYKIPIMTDIGIFFQFCPSADVVGITGTKGKSTTAFLIYKILKNIKDDVVLAGNIRVSPLEMLKQISRDTTVVLELSSWQLEGLAEYKISPHIAVITNIYPDHLNRYKSIEDYIKAKEIIFKFQKQRDVVILNHDNKILTSRGFSLHLPNVFWFSKNRLTSNGAYIDQKRGVIVFKSNGFEHTIIQLKDISLKGEHNLENVLASICASAVWGAKRTQIEESVRNFKGLGDRLEFVRKAKGVMYYNDTTATIPQAGIAALQTLQHKGKIILIAGGADKNLDYQEWAKAVCSSVKEVVFLKGGAVKQMSRAIASECPKKKFKIFHSMKQAVQYSASIAQPGEIVLLSPSAASFGLFRHEFERGEKFRECVKKL